MELWQVRREYRLVAMSLRRRKEPPDVYLEGVEEQVLSALLLCDRFHTELGVLRLAKRCALARLKRVLRWVESAGLARSIPRALTRKDDAAAAAELARALERKGRDASHLRQLLDELAHLDRRLEEARARISRMTTLSEEGLQLLLVHARVGKPAALAARTG
ncbi:MAG: hypothetical protein Q8L48_02950 [Archangium sp.]|nr:hypothetical protein [Archangium sp.]